MKAMFLAANDINSTDAESILAHQLFQIAKHLNSGELLLLRAIHRSYESGGWKRDYQSGNASYWRAMIAKKVGLGLSALMERDERALVDQGLITPIVMSGNLAQIREDSARLSDLGIRFCENMKNYRHEGGELREKAG